MRCSLLHQGNPNIKENEFGIVYFELLYNRDKSNHMLSDSSQAQIIKDENGNDKAVNKIFSISVRDMCWKICRLAENSELVSATTQLKLTAADGKKYLSDALDSEGVTKLAAEFPGKVGSDFIGWFINADDSIDGKSKQKAYSYYYEEN